MLKQWQLQEAKGNFSQLVKRAASGDPQMVTVHGRATAVVVSAEQYARLATRRGKLSDALARPELAADDLDIVRQDDCGRHVEL